MVQNIKETDEVQFALGTELRDAIVRSITQIVPNIQWKQLARLVTEFEVELENLYNLQQVEGKK